MSATPPVVAFTTPAADTALPVNLDIDVTFTSTVDGAYDLLIDGTVRGSATVTGGVGTGSVTALVGDIGTGVTLSIRESGGSVDRATRSVDVVQLAGLWLTDSRGTVTKSNSIGATPAVYYKTTVDSGFSDPDGGSNAYRITETTDASPDSHYVKIDPTNDVGTYRDIVLALKSDGRDWVNLKDSVISGAYNCWMKPSDGSVQNSAGVTATDLGDLGSGWRLFRVTWRVVGGAGVFLLAPAISPPSSTYQGDGRVCCYVYLDPSANYGLTQTRAQTVEDKSGTAANLTQVTIASQPLFQSTVEELGGIELARQESGRAASAASTNATLLALLTSSKCPYAMMGVARAADGGRVFENTVAGGGEHLTRSGADLVYTRSDGVDTRTFTFTGAGTAVTTAKAFLLAGLSDGSCTLWLDGTKYTGTPAGTEPTAMTVTKCALGSALTTSDIAFGNVALLDTTGWAGTADALKAYLDPTIDSLVTEYGL